MQKNVEFPLNNIGNWQVNEKNEEFPLNNMGNWKIIKKYGIPIE